MRSCPLKKSAVERHRLLVEASGTAVSNERSCGQCVQNFKNGQFNIEHKECSERPKVYKNEKLEA